MDNSLQKTFCLRWKGKRRERSGRLFVRTICFAIMLALCLSGTALAATLKYGSEGEDVSALQTRLAELGYYTGTISGKFDSATKAAVKLFQKANSLSADGVAGNATQAKLLSDDCVTLAQYNASLPLSKGDEGEEVVKLQSQLAALGYYTGDITGKFDSATRSAVKEFQTANSLKASGKATTQTRLLLNSGKGLSLAEYDKVRPLKSGTKGDAVVMVQNQLAALGYYTGAIDGKFDSDVKAAVKEFQTANGMKASGTADVATRTLLNAGNGVTAAEYYRICPLKSSSKGPAVVVLQQRLTALEFYDGALDGRYSSAVKTAVKYFQAANGLKATGAADANTRALMNSASCVTGATYNLICELKSGSTGVPVKVLERRLAELGYYAGEISGKYNSAVKKAVRTFQTASGLKDTGKADANTRNLMNSDSVVTRAEYDRVRPLKSGEKGDAVIMVQTQLKELGYYTGEIHGKYNSAVRTAVKTFQTANELKATGSADAETRKLLNSGKGMTAAEYDKIRLLKSGDKGDAVVMLQKQLAELGYFVDEINGRYSSSTKKAVAVLQTANGLKSTGKADMTTRKLINSGKAATREAYDAARDLKKGELGSTVRAMQNKLIELGYYSKLATGKFDSNTRTAVKLFQKAHGLKETGVADVALRALMFSEDAMTFAEYERVRAVKSGEKGDAVKQVQTALKSLGYYEGAIDGRYGSAVKAAVKLYQTANGLPVNGSLVSVEMRKMLNEGTGIPLAAYYWTVPLASGDKGEAVKKLQVRLADLGYFTDTVNGRYRSSTTEAVELFQMANSLEVTGEADANTRSIMNSDQAITRAQYEESLSAIQDAARAEKIEKLIEVAMSKLGCKYVHMTHGPNTFDCSGFTSYVFDQVGIDISTASYNQGYMDKFGKPYKAKLTSYSELQRGDLLVFDTVKDDDDLSDHLGIYLGDGTFVHASSSRGEVVISDLIPYGNFSWAFRLI